MMQTGSAIQNTSTDDLRERISIVYNDTAQDSEGNIIPQTEIVRCNVWAKVLPYANKIGEGYNETEYTTDYRVTIRYRPDVLPSDIVLWRGKRLKIIGTPYDAESRHLWTVFECRELIEDG